MEAIAGLVGALGVFLLGVGVAFTGAAIFAVALGLLQKSGASLPKPRALRRQETMPTEVRDFINQESETWAREALEAKARGLYGQLGDWSEVLAELYKGQTQASRDFEQTPGF